MNPAAFRRHLLGTCAVLATVAPAWAQLDSALFQNPPPEARPMTWMHMMNNNASKEGLAKDLQALSDAGVGGALIFSIKKGIADGKVLFNSPEFRDIIAHGAREAERLGLRIGVHNCDGWSSSGGPWITPEDAMKRVAWSEAVVSGGAVDLALPRPPTRNDFYRDIAVIAYPAPAAELAAFHNRVTLTASASADELVKLSDGNPGTPATFQASGKVQPWLLFSYEQPFTARSIHVEHNSRNGTALLSASQDGKTFSKVADLQPSYRPSKTGWAFEKSFPPVEAKFFKLEFDARIEVAQIDLAPFPRLPAWLAQSSVAEKSDSAIQKLAMPAADAFVPLDRVKVLTGALSPDGRLQAQLPPGTWRILRFGYTTTGAYNHPATDSGRGLECDKLDAAALDQHFAAYVGKLAEACGPLAGRSFYFSEIDSYEMGGQNWTRGFAEKFQADKGYDLLPFLPLLAGRLIGDPDTANAVLGDFRALVSSLMTKNYYARFTELCHQHGMKSYIEPYGNGPFNGLTAGGTADIPMGEFWMEQKSGTHYPTPVSAAHTYGKPVISAESFTSWRDLNWKIHPYLMKESGDYAWTQGINEFMFHRFAHQANPHVAPGMTMDSIGSHIDRTQTWWLNAGKAWMKYLQRGQWLLRQGVPVSDLLVYVGEGSPHDTPGRNVVKLPYGYNMDHCDTEVLLHRLSVQEGRLVLPEGTSYEALLLSNSERMSLATLRRIEQLLHEGATVIGPKPRQPFGYREQKKQSAEFAALADRIWGDGPQPRRVGSGTLIPGETWLDAATSVSIKPDLIIREEPNAQFVHRKVGGHDLYFLHNREPESRTFHSSFRVPDRIPELWYPDTGNIERQARFTQTHGRTELPLTLDPHGSVFVVFRDSAAGLDPVSKLDGPDKSARLVWESSGRIQLRARDGGVYQIQRASGALQQIHVENELSTLAAPGSWRVAFEGPGLTGPGEITLQELSDWKDHERDDIRHFSGTATYRKVIELPAGWLAENRRIYLDLGRVEIAAEVAVNGQPVGTLWKPPFAIEVTDHVQAGSNKVEIKVTNLWSNRLIGDESLERTDGYALNQPMPEWYVRNRPMPAGPRSTFTTFNFYDQDHELLPSGLLGPVRFTAEVAVPVGN